MATDKRLDQVSQLTDFDYALIVKGDQVAKASKQQLAELVGNLLYGATNASSLATVVAEQNRDNNIKIIKVEDGISLKTGLTKGGLYKWMFISKDYTIPLFFIFTDSISDYGIKMLNETWYSKNVYLSIDSDTRELVIRYTGGTSTVYLEFVG